MKAHALLASAVLLASSAAFADKDMCQTYLQQIDDRMASAEDMDAARQDEAMMHVEEARKAQKAGDANGCAMHAREAIKVLEGTGGTSGGSGASDDE